MLEQRLKYRRLTWIIPLAEKRYVRERYRVFESVVNFVVLNLVFLNHTQENKGLVYTQCMLAKQEDVRDILD